MLKVFAIDPEILDSWVTTQLWASRFGPTTCRMIAEFPRGWPRLVLEGLEGVSELDRKRIVRTLEKLKSRLVESDHPYNSDLAWLHNANYVYSSRKGFHQVIVKDEEAAQGKLLIADDLEEDSPEFHAPTGMPVIRKAEAMASSVSLFISSARSLKFIDPYFIPDKSKYRRTLKAFLARVNPDRCLGPVEIHLEDKGDVRVRFEALIASLHELVPARVVVHFYSWRKLGREAFHGRYILDSRMGFSFDHGLDEGGDSQTTDVTLVSEEIRSKRWKDFDVQNRSGEYELSLSMEVRGQVCSQWIYPPGGPVVGVGNAV